MEHVLNVIEKRLVLNKLLEKVVKASLSNIIFLFMLDILLYSIGILLRVCFVFVSSYLLPGMVTETAFARYTRQADLPHSTNLLKSKSLGYRIVETVDFSSLYPCNCSSLKVTFSSLIHI